MLCCLCKAQSTRCVHRYRAHGTLHPSLRSITLFWCTMRTSSPAGVPECLGVQVVVSCNGDGLLVIMPEASIRCLLQNAAFLWLCDLLRVVIEEEWGECCWCCPHRCFNKSGQSVAIINTMIILYSEYCLFAGINPCVWCLLRLREARPQAVAVCLCGKSAMYKNHKCTIM